MARPFIPDPTTISPDGAFIPFPRLDHGTGYEEIEETFTVPGSANQYTVRLDYAILQQVGFSVADLTASADLEFVRWGTPPGPGEVSVNHDRGLLKFHSSRVGNNIKATYRPLGTVVDAQYEMTLQKYIQSVVAAAVNAALLDAANTFTEDQKIQKSNPKFTLEGNTTEIIFEVNEPTQTLHILGGFGIKTEGYYSADGSNGIDVTIPYYHWVLGNRNMVFKNGLLVADIGDEE